MEHRFIQDPGCKPAVEKGHTSPAFKTTFYYVFGLVRNQHEFPSRRIDFNHRTDFVRPKTCYCQQQSSQYPIFPPQARDQSFTRVARNEKKYEKILDAADFARRKNYSFIRLNDAFRKTLLNAAKKTLRQPTVRAEFSLIRALISN